MEKEKTDPTFSQTLTGSCTASSSKLSSSGWLWSEPSSAAFCRAATSGTSQDASPAAMDAGSCHQIPEESKKRGLGKIGARSNSTNSHLTQKQKQDVNQAQLGGYSQQKEKQPPPKLFALDSAGMLATKPHRCSSTESSPVHWHCPAQKTAEGSFH